MRPREWQRIYHILAPKQAYRASPNRQPQVQRAGDQARLGQHAHQGRQRQAAAQVMHVTREALLE